MKRELERHEAGDVRVIPIILRPVDWKGTIFDKLQVLPTNGKPITEWSNRDQAFLDIVRGIQQVISELIKKTEEVSQNKTELIKKSLITERKTQILLVDDNIRSNRILIKYLSLIAPGYNIVEVTDGEEAIALARKRQPDLILLDLAMPALGGLEVIRQLRE